MDEMIKTITLDDKEYYVMDKLSINDIVYLYFINSNDMNDIIVRKLESDNGEFYLSQLDEDEFDTVMNAFVEKMNKE